MEFDNNQIKQSIPKVSIIMPSLNVAKYIKECMDSVVNQTLKDIEIICVDAGSTDGTLDILKEYEKDDPRVKVLISDKKSYGYQVNLGFDAARGEYLGIIETDDWAEPKMFEELYNCAKKYSLDVAKAGFYYYYSKKEVKNIPEVIASRAMSSWTFCPSTDFKVPYEMADFFNLKPSIWSAVYRNDFIKINEIRLNETPGASYQDASFNFMVWACAKRVRLMQNCYLHYRQDNENSSVNSPGKVFCVCDEYEAMEKFLNDRPVLKGRLEPVMNRIKFDTYRWNYNRLSPELRPQFLKRFHEEFKTINMSGKVYREHFEDFRWKYLKMIVTEPEEYAKLVQCRDEGREYKPKKKNNKNSKNKKLYRIVKSGIKELRQKGLLYTTNRLYQKATRRIKK